MSEEEAMEVGKQLGEYEADLAAKDGEIERLQAIVDSYGIENDGARLQVRWDRIAALDANWEAKVDELQLQLNIAAVQIEHQDELIVSISEEKAALRMLLDDMTALAFERTDKIIALERDLRAQADDCEKRGETIMYLEERVSELEEQRDDARGQVTVLDDDHVELTDDFTEATRLLRAVLKDGIDDGLLLVIGGFLGGLKEKS